MVEIYVSCHRGKGNQSYCRFAFKDALVVENAQDVSNGKYGNYRETQNHFC
jgi:hypothetical protein